MTTTARAPLFRADDVSVVIPSYNHERFVEAALASVRDQSLLPRETVVVDDGSSDRTADLVQAAQLDDLTLVRQTNQGAHAALNRAISVGRGSWIAILNSDDVFAEGRIEHALGVARAAGAALLVGRVALIDERGAPLEAAHPTAAWYRSALGAAGRAPSLAAALREHNVAVTTSNFFFHRELWARLGGFRSYRYVHDYDFLLRALELCPDQVRFEPALEDVRYRVHGANTITENVDRARAERRSLLDARARPWRRAARALGWAPGRAAVRRAGTAAELPVARALAIRQTGTAERAPLRCGLVVERLDRGGLEDVVASLALQLPACGIEPFVLCTSAGGATAARLERAGVRVRVARAGAADFRAWAQEVGPHVLSAHFIGLDVVAALAPLGVPIVETIHNTYAWLQPADWERESAKQALLFGTVAVSRTAARYFLRRLQGVPHAERPRAPLALIPNGVRPARVCSLPRDLARRSLAVASDRVVLAHTGRMCAQKNQLGLVAAFRAALDERPDALLLLMGDASDRAYAAAVGASAADLVAAGRVRILPARDDVAPLLSAADVWVSNSFFEGWSVGATEALCCGVPVVSSDVGGARELAGAHGERGFVVPNPAGDPLAVRPESLSRPDARPAALNREQLARALIDATDGRFADPERRAGIRRWARARFADAAMARAHAGVLRAAAAGRPSERAARGARVPEPV